MRNHFFFLLFFVSSFYGHSQVTGVSYMWEYDIKKEVFECFLRVDSGSASDISELLQLNSQISIVTPKGASVEVVENFNPKQQSSGLPNFWFKTFTLSSASFPTEDFHAFLPSFNPPGIYDPLEAGDTVKLFACKISGDNICATTVRLFENDEDPDSNHPGMEGQNFSNFFTISGSSSIYNGNINNPSGEPEPTIQFSIDYICGDSCFVINPCFSCVDPTTLSYNWSTGNTTPSITVCPNTPTSYTLEIIDEEGFQTAESVILNPVIPEDFYIIFDGCEGEVLSIEGETIVLDSSQILIDTLYDETFGCPLLFTTIELNVIPNQDIVIDTTICEGMDYEGLYITGTYVMEGADENGCIFFTTVNLIVLPVDDPGCSVATKDLEDKKLTIFPNPTSHILTIRSDEIIKTLRILDFTGKVVENLKVQDTEFTLFTELLEAGLYILETRFLDDTVLFERFVRK